MEPLTVIRSMPLLRQMRDAGHITFHAQTGTKISGLYSHDKFTCYYVDDSTHSTWEFKGHTYSLKYFDGCFCPYVVLIK